MTKTRLLFTTLTAALALTALVSIANARRFEFSSQQIRSVWTQTDPLTFGNGFTKIDCAVTLEGSFHSRTITKLSGLLIGAITRAATSNCAGSGSVNFLQTTLPWHIRYRVFFGRLPAITSIGTQLVGVSYIEELVSMNCLYRSTAGSPWTATIELNTMTGLVTALKIRQQSEGGMFVPLFEGPALCSEIDEVRGPGELTILNTTTGIIVRLVP